MWDARAYLKFSSERSRPFADLISQVPCEEPRLVVDLGCGTGQIMRELAQRWPRARVIGVDNSPEMLEAAIDSNNSGRCEFERADIGTWSPPQPIDLIVSNAALHWLPDHDGLLNRLAAMLSVRGTLAVQMPNRFGTPSQSAIEETAADPRWAAALTGVGLHRHSVMTLTWYVEHLHVLGFNVNAWETTYLHVLNGEDAVLEWLKGTALRPLLQRLDAEEKSEFLGQLGARLRDAYPSCDSGESLGRITLFPMPRLFIVATRRSV